MKKKTACLVFIIGALFCNIEAAFSGENDSVMTEHIERVNTAIKEYGQYLSEKHRHAILAGKIELGMTPFEAKTAGGAFVFAVTADKERWTGDIVNPYDVMWNQSVEPDNSEIVMTFKNETQFPGEGLTVFRVRFERGHAVNIEKMKKNQKNRKDK